MHLVGLGLERIVAVAMRDAVLVADMDRSQDVKKVVQALKAGQGGAGRGLSALSPAMGLVRNALPRQPLPGEADHGQPGGILSLQSHMHRSEHWVVVAGTARVTIGEDVRLLTENQSVYIPLGSIHRMENPGKVPMYLIEVQTGTYLGEDDIERYEDVYHRT